MARERVIIYDREESETRTHLFRQTCDIVAYLITDEMMSEFPTDLPHILFEKICSIDYDRILIMQVDGFDTIKERLRKLGAEDEQIVYGGGYLNIHPSWDYPQLIFQDMTDNNYDALTDLGFQLAKENLFNGPHDGVPKERKHDIKIYGCSMDDNDALPEPIFCNLYEEIFTEISALPEKVRNQCLYLGSIYHYMALDTALEFVLMFLDVFDVVYYCIPFPDTTKHRAWRLFKTISDVQIEEWYTGHDDVLVRIKRMRNDTQVKIYVASHNAPPDYVSDTYVPIWLGKAENNTYGYEGSDLEPEIAAMNPRINECTGLYWIWKHSDADVKGMAHYRRFYGSETNSQIPILERDEILRLLSHYDIILTRLFTPTFPVAIHFANSLRRDVRELGIQVFEKWISIRQPDYVNAFRKVMYGNSFYLCQMIIAPKSIFDDYCEWLFSFLLDAAQELDFDRYKDSNHRVSGYMAECMLTVWLMNQTLKIKEVPMIYTG